METARKNFLLNHSPRVREESKTTQVKDDGAGGWGKQWQQLNSEWVEGLGQKQQSQAFPLVGKEVAAMNLARGWVVGMRVIVWSTSN